MQVEQDLITEMLGNSKIIAVVGLSPKPARASYGVAAYMQAQGYRIISVNPREAGKTILGELCYADLITAAADHRIDIVNCFRNADDIPPVVEEAIRIAAPYLWMQQGIVNVPAAEKAEAAGIRVVMDKCLKIEHHMRF
ncbi:CoA-binding protein [Undibacterium sp. Ji49W]|uniref:CoA-binding protein n=1 Tax=Undibacterium sp. Ji49W TaxID=3413040 RepID=UPI003BF42C80